MASHRLAGGNSAHVTVAVLLAAVHVLPVVAQPKHSPPVTADFQLEFEPMLDDIMVLSSALDAIDKGSRPPPAMLDLREDKLDQALEAQFGGMLSSVGLPPAQRLRAGSLLEQAPPHHHAPDIPLEVFRNLFPGPLIIEEDDGRSSSMTALGSPDPFVMDMLSETHAGFQDEMLPMVHSAQAAMRSPKTCHKDITKHCSKARSQLHCLGSHREDISKECHDDVGKSVPFICSESIDKFCDTLRGGILPCLTQHLGSLQQNCRDAVETTRAVIHNANTHKVVLSQVSTGVKRAPVLPPKQVAVTAVHKELELQNAIAGSMRTPLKHSLFFFVLGVLLFVMYRGPTIYLPDWLTSKLATLRRQLLKSSGSGSATGLLDMVSYGCGGKDPEKQHIFAGACSTELPQTVDCSPKPAC